MPKSPSGNLYAAERSELLRNQVRQWTTVGGGVVLALVLLSYFLNVETSYDVLTKVAISGERCSSVFDRAVLEARDQDSLEASSLVKVEKSSDGKMVSFSIRLPQKHRAQQALDHFVDWTLKRVNSEAPREVFERLLKAKQAEIRAKTDRLKEEIAAADGQVFAPKELVPIRDRLASQRVTYLQTEIEDEVDSICKIYSESERMTRQSQRKRQQERIRETSEQLSRVLKETAAEDQLGQYEQVLLLDREVQVADGLGEIENRFSHYVRRPERLSISKITRWPLTEASLATLAVIIATLGLSSWAQSCVPRPEPDGYARR